MSKFFPASLIGLIGCKDTQYKSADRKNRFLVGRQGAFGFWWYSLEDFGPTNLTAWSCELTIASETIIYSGFE